MDLVLTVNGQQRKAPAGTTLRELLELLGLGGTRVAVEVNLEVVPRNRHAETSLSDGDRIEIVHFVGGGECER